MRNPWKTRHYHPWGYYDLLSSGIECSVKLVTICEKQQLAFQYHANKTETYYLIDPLLIGYSIIPFQADSFNRMEVEVDKFIRENVVSYIASPGQIFTFPPFTLHRARCPDGFANVRYLEIAFGESGEEDIVRVKDWYKRDRITAER